MRKGTAKSETAENAEAWSDAAVALRWAKKAEADARTQKLQMEIDEASGKVWAEADIRPYFGRVWASFRVQLMEFPEALAERLNPIDPPAASIILEDAIRRLLDSTCSQLETFIPPIRRAAAPGARKGKVAKAH